jgi:RHS repeat-associated protein
VPVYNPDPTIYNGQSGVWTVVKRDHIKQLRDGATRGQGAAAGGSGTPVPADGLGGLTYDSASNRVTTAGWEYDSAGSQTRGRNTSGGWQRYEYDAAGRLVKVLSDDRTVVLATYTYGDSNERLIAEEGGSRTYFVTGGAGVVMEYSEALSSTQPQWSKSYVYLGARLLSVITPNGGGGEYVEYHHPDRLGTRLISNATDSSVQGQSTLPYGTVLTAETSAATTRRFTSYDRSSATGLDYAVNRHYDAQQGRFTQVDPIGMGGASLFSPQTLNLYAYCGNDPVNHTDPDGLFWGKLFHFLGKVLKWVGIAAIVATAVISVVGLIAGPAALHTFLTATLLGKVLGFIADIPGIIGSKIAGVGQAIAGVFSFAEDGGVSALVARVIGFGVMFGSSAAAGAIYKFQTREQQQILDRNKHWRNRKYWPRVPRPRKVARMPDGKPIEPEIPQDAQPEVRTPEEFPVPKQDPTNPSLPENATRWQRARFAISAILRGIGNYLSDITIMVDPSVLAEEACRENPGGSVCRDFKKYIKPEDYCKIFRCL